MPPNPFLASAPRLYQATFERGFGMLLAAEPKRSRHQETDETHAQSAVNRGGHHGTAESRIPKQEEESDETVVRSPVPSPAIPHASPRSESSTPGAKRGAFTRVRWVSGFGRAEDPIRPGLRAGAG